MLHLNSKLGQLKDALMMELHRLEAKVDFFKLRYNLEEKVRILSCFRLTKRSLLDLIFTNTFKIYVFLLSQFTERFRMLCRQYQHLEK